MKRNLSLLALIAILSITTLSCQDDEVESESDDPANSRGEKESSEGESEVVNGVFLFEDWEYIDLNKLLESL